MKAKETARGKRKRRCRGSSRTRMTLKPRLALWAGVGVFVFAWIVIACEEENPPPPLADDGYIWAAPGYCHFDFLKIGNNTGAVVQTLDLEEEPFACLGMVVGPETGNIYILARDRLRKYDREGELVYSFDMGWEDDFEVDEGHDALWTYDWFYLSLWSAASGEPVGGVKYEPDTVTAFRVSADDGGIWIAGTSGQGSEKVVVKYSKGLKKERTLELEAKPEYIDVNGTNGDVWVTWSKKNTLGEMRWFVSRYSREGYYYGDVVVKNRVKGVKANEYTGGCFIRFRDGVAEYSAARELIARWPIPDLKGLTTDPATGDFYAAGFVKKVGYILYKIDGDMKRVVWRTDLGYVEGKYLACCSK